MKDLDARLRLIVIADRGRIADDDLCRCVGEALDAGAPAVQLRDKTSGAADTLELARSLREACGARNALFFVNDRVDIALAAGADGVHLGPEDPPVRVARELGGGDFLIGASAGTVLEAEQAERDGADYLGCGSVFATRSKADAGVPIGLQGLGAVVRAVPIPVVAIGGIRPLAAPLIREAGAAGSAVISALLGPAPVYETVRSLLAPWDSSAG